MNSQKIKEVLEALGNIEYCLKDEYPQAALMEVEIMKEMLKKELEKEIDTENGLCYISSVSETQNKTQGD